MIIIVEGPDNAGKSTLAAQLAKTLKAFYMKSERVPPTQQSAVAFQIIADFADDVYGNVVCDRHPYVSEIVYSEVLRGGTQLDLPSSRLVGTRIIYCLPPKNAIIHSILERDQMEGVVDNIEQLIHAYERFFRPPFSLPHLKFDYTVHTEADVLAWLAE